MSFVISPEDMNMLETISAGSAVALRNAMERKRPLSLVERSPPEYQEMVTDFVQRTTDPMVMSALEGLLDGQYPVFTQKGPIARRKFGLSPDSVAFRRGPGVVVDMVPFSEVLNILRLIAFDRLKHEDFELSIKSSPVGAL